MDNSDIDILDLLAEDRELITYRKSLNYITGGVLATILLQQILYWSKKGGWEPFYKFRMPCSHQLYKAGYSWSEELGFTPYEFDAALDQIGTKITKGTKKTDAFKKFSPRAIIIYWTDASRVTWYQVNRQLLGNLIKCNYLVIGFCPITLESDKVQLPLTETPSEIPTETLGASAENELDNFFEPKPANILPLKPSQPSITERIRTKDPMTLLGALGVTAQAQASPGIILLKEADWHINSQNIERAIADFLEATGLPVPAKPERGKWLRHAKEHLEEFKDLKTIYGKAWDEYKPFIKAGQIDITHPGALTVKMRAILQRQPIPVSQTQLTEGQQSRYQQLLAEEQQRNGTT